MEIWITILFVSVIVMFIAYLVSRSAHSELSEMGDDRVYKKEIRLYTFEIVCAVIVGIMGIISAANSRVPLATTGPTSYGGVFGGIIVVICLMIKLVKVVDAREQCLKAKRLEEIEQKSPKRTLNRRLSMPCDPETEWRCPRCKSVNSKLTGTCGCGYSVYNADDSLEQEQPEYYPDSECDPETEWKCPSCGKINSNYVGTCGCGHSRAK